jgi:hypothetical protein
MNQPITRLHRASGELSTRMEQRRNVCTDTGMIQQFYKDHGMVASPRSLEYVWLQYFDAIERDYYNYNQYRSNVTKWRDIAMQMDVIVNG